MKGYKITIDKEALGDMFQSTTSSTARLAIMHYAAVHARDLAMTKNVSTYMLWLCCTNRPVYFLKCRTVKCVIRNFYSCLKVL